MYVKKINQYLSKFGTNVEISNLNKKDSHFIYYLRINKINVRSSNNTISLKRTLSEGEKNCLAFAFFLARLDLSENLKDQIVIFDDPISSLDSRRRSITLTILNNLASRVKQLIILSHDANFIRDFSNRNSNVKQLCIRDNAKGSSIQDYDVNTENKIGLFLDIEKINKYSSEGYISGLDKRDVIRCIRPVLEGFLRIKFYGLLQDKEWLGDFIQKIRKSQNDSLFFRYKNFLMDIEDLNDYTKMYHHSNPVKNENPITDAELQQKCKNTMELLQKL